MLLGDLLEIGGEVVAGEGVLLAADLGDEFGELALRDGLSVPLNIRCSRKWAMPDLPSGSSAAPLRYQTMWVTTGRAMVGNDHDLEAVLESEMGDLRGGR